MRLQLLFLIAASALFATDAKDGYVQVSLERQEGSDWKALDPRVVLNAKDRIRFKFETTYAGFLYVYNRGSDGATDRLLPGDGADNRVEPGKSFTVPASGSFVIDGPAGFDITYWIVSPEPLARIPMFDDAPATATTGPSTLIPRCKEGLVARGGAGSGCLDERAGPQATVNPGKIVPKAQSTLRPRSIRLEKDGEARIAAPASKQAPLIYEFRVAHK
jgi:hypothetical protein